jgi:WD40 repeat protein
MEPAKTSSLACSIPSPLFILQNAHPVNYVQFSDSNSNLIYSGNRNGDLSIYDLKFRRSLFSKNANNQPVLSIIELNESCLLSQNRSGSIFKWNLNDVSNWNFERIILLGLDIDKQAFIYEHLFLSHV